MKIKRNGVEIELTSEEIRLIFEKKQMEYDIEDIESVLEEDEDYPPVTPEAIRKMAKRKRALMGDNMPWREASEQAIKDVLDEMPTIDLTVKVKNGKIFIKSENSIEVVYDGTSPNDIAYAVECYLQDY